LPDQSAPRIDPPSRVVDGAINDVARWSNLDPKRDYCEANPNDADTGVPELRRCGWRLETHSKDGPKLLGGDAASDGSQLVRNGMYLMSRPNEATRKYEAEKFQVAKDRSKAIGQNGGADPVVGPYGLAKSTADAREQLVRG
jgi:hypothetical protein